MLSWNSKEDRTMQSVVLVTESRLRVRKKEVYTKFESHLQDDPIITPHGSLRVGSPSEPDFAAGPLVRDGKDDSEPMCRPGGTIGRPNADGCKSLCLDL